MVPVWLYHLLALLLFTINVTGAALNLVALPGNWLVVSACSIFALLVHTSSGWGMHWGVIGTLVAFALLGEAVELLAGTAGAARYGASRRSMVLSIVGSVVGSVTGACVGLPVPFVGSAFAALLGGALGAFFGAVVGEQWKGKDAATSVTVGHAAFWGRLLGTAGKTVVGVIMVVVATLDVWFT